MLEHYGFNFSTGVPCSILNNIIVHLSSSSSLPYFPATNEDEAMGMATGAYLGGRKPVVLLQNSGLGFIINPLTSLDILYRIPILLVISWRGYEGKDAPEHLIMGQAMMKILEDIGVTPHVISADDPEAAISASARIMDEDRIPAAAILRNGIIV